MKATLLLTLPLVLLTGGCSTSLEVASEAKRSTSVRPGDSTFVRLENRLARRLLDEAWDQIEGASEQDRLTFASASRDKLHRSLNVSLLTMDLRLLLQRYLDHVDHLANDRSPASFQDHRDGIWSHQTIFDAGLAEVDQLSSHIERMTHEPYGASLQASRERPDNYLSDSEDGRQRYLDLVQQAIKASDTGLSLPPLAIQGIEDVQAPLFDYQDSVLLINLHDMSALPLDEITVQTSFYTVPGLHAASAYDLRGLTSEDIDRWAAYMSCRTCPPNEAEVSELVHARNLAALMVAETALAGLGWSRNSAREYLARETSYPGSRIEEELRRMTGTPTEWRARTYGRLLIQQMVDESAMPANELMSEHGPQTLSMLQALLSGCLDDGAIGRAIDSTTRPSTAGSDGSVDAPVRGECPDILSR